MTNQQDEEPQIVDRRASSRMDAAGAQEKAEPTPAASEPAEVDAAVAAERAKAEQYYASWQRSAADFANFKRRVESERSEQARLTAAALVINILPIFDDLDRAVNSVDASLAGLNWVQGVGAIHRKFASLLEAMGVAEIPAAGQPFDPSVHEAVANQPGPDGRVIAVVQKGYALHEKVVRPAMVIVGNGESPASPGAASAG